MSTHRKTITAPTPMEIDAFQGNCHKCGKYGHTAKECRSSSQEGQRSLIVHNVERNIIDSVGYGATHHPTKIHRKEYGKVTKKETAREPRKVESSEEEKAETMGKEKVEERKDNVSTKSQNHQKNSGQVDLGNNGQNDVGAQKSTLRVGVTMIGTQQIRILRPQRQLKNFNMRLSVICDSRIWVSSNASNLCNMDRLDHSQRDITFGIDTAACQTVVPANHLAARGYLVHKESLLGCASSTAGRDKVHDQGKRIEIKRVSRVIFVSHKLKAQLQERFLRGRQAYLATQWI